MTINHYQPNDGFADELSTYTHMKITIPESFDEVTISQLREISMLDDANKTKYAIDVASILSNTDPEVIRKLNATYLNQITQSLQFIADLPKMGYKQSFTHNGQLYAINDFQYMTLGQWIDIEELGKDWKNNLHKILAVIYLPAEEIKGKLKIEPYDGKFESRAEIMDLRPVSEVYSASVFFSSFAEQLMFDSSLRTLNREIQILQKNLPRWKRIMRSGIGTKSWIGYQVNRLSIWRRLRKKTL